MSFKSTISPLLSLMLCTAATSQASILGFADGYNALIFNNMTLTNGNIGGKLAVGGNTSLTGASIGSQLPSGPADNLIVGGNLTWKNGQLSQGNGKVGGNQSLKGVGTPNGTIASGAPFDFDSAEIELLAISSYLGEFDDNGTATVEWGGLKLIGSDASLNVFQVSAADLSKANGFSLTAPTGSTVLVNVTGHSSVKLSNFAYSYTNVDKANVLFNFVDASNLVIQNHAAQGSYLAPGAHVTFQNGQLDGALIAKSLTAHGIGAQYTGFGGGVPFQTTQTPEPSTWAMMAGGAALVAVGARRRKR